MIFSAATVLAIFLLIVAASLASYLFIQWSALRSAGGVLGWLGLSIGVALLLVAAVVVVLPVSFLAAFRPWGHDLFGEVVEPVGLGTSIGSPGFETPDARSGQASDASRTRRVGADRGVGVNIDAGRVRQETQRDGDSRLTSARPQEEGRGVGTRAAAHADMKGGSVAADPWAATDCVWAYNPDPADLTHWTVENGCNVPVGIVFAACTGSAQECTGQFWDYSEEMILPGKIQRPVPLAEETRYGQRIRYIACTVAGAEAAKLIGSNSETRASSSWKEQFEAARDNDECLARVRYWSEAGSSSGMPIDVLLGVRLPGRVRGET